MVILNKSQPSRVGLPYKALGLRSAQPRDVALHCRRGRFPTSAALLSDLLESGFNPHTSSHGLSGAELTRLPLNAPTSNQKSNCNARLSTKLLPTALSVISSPSARARPDGAVGEAARAMVGDGGAVSWHGSARAISLLFPLRLRSIHSRLPEFLGAFEQPLLAAGLFVCRRC